jgi:hypothetical protein
VWVLVGASVGLLSHRLWLDSREREPQPGRLAASWHAIRSEAPFALVAGALLVLPRRRGPAAALCLTAALVTVLAVVGHRTLAASGHGLAIHLGLSPLAAQFLLAMVGCLVAAALAVWESADTRRP